MRRWLRPKLFVLLAWLAAVCALVATSELFPPSRLELLGSRGLSSCHFSPDGRFLCSISLIPSECRLWDASSGVPLPLPEDAQNIGLVEFVPNSWRVFVSDDSGWRVWDLRQGRWLDDYCRIISPRTWLAFSQGGSTLAVIDSDGRGMDLWDLEYGKRLGRVNDATLLKSPYRVPHFVGERAVAFLDRDRQVHVWDVTEGRDRLVIDTAAITAPLTTNGQLVAGGAEQVAHLWSLSTGEQTRLTVDGPISEVMLSPDGTTVAVVYDRIDAGQGERIKSLKLFDSASSSLVLSIDPDGSDELGDVHFTPSGRFLMTKLGGANRFDRTTFWDVSRCPAVKRADLFPEELVRSDGRVVVGMSSSQGGGTSPTPWTRRYLCSTDCFGIPRLKLDHRTSSRWAIIQAPFDVEQGWLDSWLLSRLEPFRRRYRHTLIDLESFTEVRSWFGDSGFGGSLSYAAAGHGDVSPDGRLLVVTGTDGGPTRVYDLPLGHHPLYYASALLLAVVAATTVLSLLVRRRQRR